MKPLALRLQAFGSYAGEFGIDFARLGRHGVFSITGPTGAGKSTIFDAIVYALYDDLPGFRVNSHIRSQYAEPGTRTEVTFEFEAEGRHWVLTRTPAQSRPKARGSSGLVDDPSKVVLSEAGIEGTAVTRKRDVTERIGELVGLDKAQFEQVVLLPQGKFEEVLKAKTQERADLLAKLFPVDVYVRTTEALRQLAAERRDTYEELTRGRRAAEDRIRAEVAAFVSEARSESSVDAVRPEGSTDGTPDAADAVDLTRLPEVRTGLLAELTSVTGARDAAAAAREATRSRRAEAEAAVHRWEQWRADVAAAQGHPDEEAADAELLLALERAGTVATLATSLAAWRAATDRLTGLDVERRRLRSVVEASWVDGHDRTALDSATAAHLLAATVGSEAAALEAADHRFVDLERQGVELTSDERSLADRSLARSDAVARLDAIMARTAELETVQAAGAAQEALRPVADVRVEQLERDAADARARAVTDLELVELVSELAGARRRLAEAEELSTALRGAWRSGLAGRLAAHLHDGHPCPTCGATEHPQPAVPAEDAPSDEELEAADEATRACVEEQRALELRVAESRARLEVLPEVGDGAEVEERLATARSELEAIDADVAARAERGRALDQLRLDAGSLATMIEAERSELDGKVGALTERRARWEADRDAFVTEHGTFTSTAAVASVRREVAGAIADLAANLEATAGATSARSEHLTAMAPTLADFGIDDPAGLARWSISDEEGRAARMGLDERSERRREVAARIADYVAGGGPDQAPPVDPALQAEREAAETHDRLVGRVASMTGRLAAVDTAIAELADGAAAVSEALLAKEAADTLAGVCAGLGTGPDATRLSLKNWVLAYYLRQVLAHANRRLDTMTNGRYALALSEEHTDGRRPWGLDISVRDAETGQSRPATTLSGGETFMAALALALGLADVVSSGSNYSIGALFVDEGFGSLDGDSLDTVIEVLRSLQDGGRMVGVISHVQELKDALPNGITIASTNHGSVATIHYPDA